VLRSRGSPAGVGAGVPAVRADGKLPQLEIVYLPSDHTNGTTAGEATPASYMADNDLALGKLVEDVSHSQYWQSTAIIVLEDDAQDGPDHVDATDRRRL
jgi:DNA-binding beta-propeller fold protein YncE